jgi:hypothetical protein
MLIGNPGKTDRMIRNQARKNQILMNQERKNQMSERFTGRRMILTKGWSLKTGCWTLRGRTEPGSRIKLPV